MPNDSFSLIDLYTKYVINSKGEKQIFDENSIAKILNKETGLDIHIAEKVAGRCHSKNNRSWNG